jgi:hypothetical protein
VRRVRARAEIEAALATQERATAARKIEEHKAWRRGNATGA